MLEPESGMLRYICYDGRELLRGIYIAVRDPNWGTVTPAISNLIISNGDAAAPASISFEASCIEGDIDFAYRAYVRFAKTGELVCSMKGIARSRFLKNRIGFCILHPLRGNRGRACKVVHADGQEAEGHFPSLIAPHQPFKSLSGLRWHDEYIEASLEFEGDKFEMEDQRNWTDASYKTYCTPLNLPFPVQVEEGDVVEQHIRLSAIRYGDGAYDESSTTVAAKRDEVEGVAIRPGLPKLGLVFAYDAPYPNADQVRQLQRLRLGHLRVDLKMASQDWRSRLELATQLAGELDTELCVAVTLSQSELCQLEALRAECQTLQTSVTQWLIFHEDEKATSARWIRHAREHLADLNSQSLFAGGTDAYFAELNRVRPDVSPLDALSYSINPQVHASDSLSIIETLEAQSDTVRTAESFAGDRPIWISPLTLRPRFNPNATAAEPPTPKGELPAQVDPRQRDLFAAGWTLASVAELASAGAASVTLYETTGWKGVIERADGSLLSDRFPSQPGELFPVYFVLQAIGEVTEPEVEVCRCGIDNTQLALHLHNERHSRWLVTNLSTDTSMVRVADFVGAERSTCRMIRVSQLFRNQAVSDGLMDTALRLDSGELELSPLDVALIDLEQAGSAYA